MTSEAATADPGSRLRDTDGAFAFEPHRCFACGELNEHGLHLELHTNPDGAWLETTIADEFQGWDAIAHGGIVCTLLDEVMAWSVIGNGTWGVTARLNVAFRRPLRTGTKVRAEGRVVSMDRRAAKTAGRVFDPSTGQVFATAEGTFMAVPEADRPRLMARYGMRRLDAAGALAGGSPSAS